MSRPSRADGYRHFTVWQIARMRAWFYLLGFLGGVGFSAVVFLLLWTGTREFATRLGLGVFL